MTIKEMIVGFSGTQLGMTPLQRVKFLRVIYALQPKEFHHGDCIGADAEAHNLIRKNLPECKIHIHPPDDPGKRAFCDGDKLYPEKPYLERNRDIVLHSKVLVTTPGQPAEIMRSGTWSTTRYGRQVLPKGHLRIIYPNGTVGIE